MNNKIAALLIVGACVSSSFAKKNQYMVEGSEEFGKVTANVVGTWNIDSYVRSDKGEQFGSIYKSGTIELKKPEKAGKRGEIVVTFALTDSIIGIRKEAVVEEEGDFTVDSYKLTFEGKWDVYDKEPNIIRIQMGDEFAFDISGENKKAIEEFIDQEDGFINGSKALGSIGGLGGYVAQKSMESGSGINDISAEFPYKIDFTVSDNSMEAKGNGDLSFKLSK